MMWCLREDGIHWKQELVRNGCGSVSGALLVQAKATSPADEGEEGREQVQASILRLPRPYNESRCHIKGCKFPHVCEVCRENHPKRLCGARPWKA